MLSQAEVGDAGLGGLSVGVSAATFYRWSKRFGSLWVTELRELRQLRDENRKLKQLVADLSPDKVILQATMRKKL